MTREEAIKMAKADLKCMERDTSGQDEMCNSHKCDECSLNYERGNMGEQKEWLRMAIQTLEQTQWIPVSERLPKAGEYVGDVDKYYLVQNEYGDMMVARYTHSEYWEQIFQLKPIGDEIVAWMPLPESYKAESEDKE